MNMVAVVAYLDILWRDLQETSHKLAIAGNCAEVRNRKSRTRRNLVMASLK